jgi:hypothetical protein
VIPEQRTSRERNCLEFLRESVALRSSSSRSKADLKTTADPLREFTYDPLVEGYPSCDWRMSEMTVLGTINPARIASALCIVSVNVRNVRGQEESRDNGFDVGPIDHIGIQHHALDIIGAQGQEAHAHDFWDFVHSIVGIFCAFSDEYGVGGPIGSISRLADMIEEQEPLSDRGVSHFDAVWKARPLIGYVPLDPMEREFLVAETIQMSEG